jgi:hypothetical protein
MYGESELVIMIAVATEEMHGSDRSPNLQRITRRAWLDEALFQRERNGALLRVHAAVCSKLLDTADIVRDAIYRQLVCRLTSTAVLT